ncbi:Microcystin-dependent protein [Spirosomataceae bacterium TFI 002]|nr:Microcystin-dependent protein [Spirosomataceae bacterium TFI 002]
MEGYIGQLMMFAGSFAPRSWAFCDGSLLSIASNQALFSIIGTTYGGDGRTTFALPDLRGRVPVKFGTGPGLSHYQIGQKSGTETVTLNATEMPSHNHTVAINVTNGAGSQATPGGGHLANITNGYSDEGTAGAFLAGATTGNNGGNRAHTNLQPLLAVNFIICLYGIFPSRN